MSRTNFIFLKRKMNQKTLKKQKQKNLLVEQIFEEILLEKEQEILTRKDFEKLLSCGNRHGKYLNKCNDKFCKICAVRNRHERYNKIEQSIFGSEKFAGKKGYSEHFVTFTVDYLQYAENENYKEIFSSFLKKFFKEIRKKDKEISYILKREIAYNEKNNCNNIHSHALVYTKNIDIFSETWQKVTEKQGSISFKFDEVRRKKGTELTEEMKKIMNYLAKDPISCNGITAEKIEDKELLKKIILSTKKTVKNWRTLEFTGVYSPKKSEKKRKEERGRTFVIQDFSREKFEKEKIYVNAKMAVNGNDLLLKFEHNNCRVGQLEKKFGGSATTIKNEKWEKLLEQLGIKEMKDTYIGKQKKRNEQLESWDKKTDVIIPVVLPYSVETNEDKEEIKRLKKIIAEKDKVLIEKDKALLKKDEIIKMLMVSSKNKDEEIKEMKTREKKIALFLLANYNNFNKLE